MPCIHPSETPPLGWLVPCLAVQDLRASIDFYGRLDFVRYGGDPDRGWAMLRNRAVEIHLFQGHIPADLLNFRGGNLPVIRAALSDRGLEVSSEEGKASFIYRDPDGREVFFDTSEEESTEYELGLALTGGVTMDEVHEGDGLDLGNLTWCLACESLEATSAFYASLGLTPCDSEAMTWRSVLARRDHLPAPGTRVVATYLSLFENRIPKDTLNLRGGNVAANAEALAERGLDLGQGVQIGPDGGESLLLFDPDERPVFLDTTPPERLYLS